VENYDPSLPPVMGDHDQLVQAFLNLVKNAAEAAPGEAGEIVLGTAFQPGLRLAGPSGEGRLRLPLVASVQDNGGGIPAELRANLFEPFITSKTSGTGLGLPLVAKIIGDHGGTVEYTSEPGRTIFLVMLPFHDEAGS
jgi:two-component system nitrogen regulation sensor histidine kinase GlnL